jgi:hypothetical protein
MSLQKSFSLWKTALLGAGLIATTYAQDNVSISGELKSDMGVYFDTDFDYSTQANHELSLSLEGTIDEGVGAQVDILAATTQSADSTAQSHFRSRDLGASIIDGASLYSSLALDGIRMYWDFVENGRFLFGDLSYNHGSTSYYGWQSGDYSAILPDQNIRGIGMEVADGVFYIGAPDNGNDFGITAYASYDIALINKASAQWSLSPIFDIVLSGNARFHNHTMGLESEYSSSLGSLDYSALIAFGILPFEGEQSYTILAEPSLGYENFSLGMIWYQAILADSEQSYNKQTYMPEQQLMVLEPGFSFHPKFALGLPLEYHNISLDETDDSYARVSPSLYVYPTLNAELSFWGAYDIQLEKGDNLYSYGLEANIQF